MSGRKQKTKTTTPFADTVNSETGAADTATTETAPHSSATHEVPPAHHSSGPTSEAQTEGTCVSETACDIRKRRFERIAQASKILKTNGEFWRQQSKGGNKITISGIILGVYNSEVQMNGTSAVSTSISLLVTSNFSKLSDDQLSDLGAMRDPLNPQGIVLPLCVQTEKSRQDQEAARQMGAKLKKEYYSFTDPEPGHCKSMSLAPMHVVKLGALNNESASRLADYNNELVHATFSDTHFVYWPESMSKPRKADEEPVLYPESYQASFGGIVVSHVLHVGEEISTFFKSLPPSAFLVPTNSSEFGSFLHCSGESDELTKMDGDDSPYACFDKEEPACVAGLSFNTTLSAEAYIRETLAKTKIPSVNLIFQLVQRLRGIERTESTTMLARHLGPMQTGLFGSACPIEVSTFMRLYLPRMAEFINAIVVPNSNQNCFGNSLLTEEETQLGLNGVLLASRTRLFFDIDAFLIKHGCKVTSEFMISTLYEGNGKEFRAKYRPWVKVNAAKPTESLENPKTSARAVNLRASNNQIKEALFPAYVQDFFVLHDQELPFLTPNDEDEAYQLKAYKSLNPQQMSDYLLGKKVSVSVSDEKGEKVVELYHSGFKNATFQFFSFAPAAVEPRRDGFPSMVKEIADITSNMASMEHLFDSNVATKLIQKVIIDGTVSSAVYMIENGTVAAQPQAMAIEYNEEHDMTVDADIQQPVVEEIVAH